MSETMTRGGFKPIGHRSLGWGRPVPAHATTAMGARAILMRGYPPCIDFVRDRMAWEGEPEDCRELSAWISNTAVPLLRKRIMDEGISLMSTDVIDIEDGRFFLEASPQGSGGYLYIGAWTEY